MSRAGALAGVAHGTRRGQQVLDAAAERAVGEVASALAEAGEVETQHANALARERAPDTDRGERLLGAGEAVSEQRIRMRRPVRKIELADQARPVLALEFERFGAHHAAPGGWRVVRTSTPPFKVSVTGVFSLTSSKRAVCAWSSSPCSEMLRSM